MTGKGILAAVGKPPRDPAVLQAYEFSQQELVDSIMRRLHQDVGDGDDYFKTFGIIAHHLLEVLRGGSAVGYVRDQIVEPVEDFTPHVAEKDYLLLKVFEKTFAVVANEITSDYTSLQFGG